MKKYCDIHKFMLKAFHISKYISNVEERPRLNHCYGKCGYFGHKVTYIIYMTLIRLWEHSTFLLACPKMTPFHCTHEYITIAPLNWRINKATLFVEHKFTHQFLWCFYQFSWKNGCSVYKKVDINKPAFHWYNIEMKKRNIRLKVFHCDCHQVELVYLLFFILINLWQCVLVLMCLAHWLKPLSKVTF